MFKKQGLCKSSACVKRFVYEKSLRLQNWHCAAQRNCQNIEEDEEDEQEEEDEKDEEQKEDEAKRREEGRGGEGRGGGGGEIETWGIAPTQWTC